MDRKRALWCWLLPFNFWLFSVFSQRQSREGGTKSGQKREESPVQAQPTKTSSTFIDRRRLLSSNISCRRGRRSWCQSACDRLQQCQQSTRRRSLRGAEGCRGPKPRQKGAGVGWLSLPVSSPPSAPGQWPGDSMCVFVLVCELKRPYF